MSHGIDSSICSELTDSCSVILCSSLSAVLTLGRRKVRLRLLFRGRHIWAEEAAGNRKQEVILWSDGLCYQPDDRDFDHAMKR